MKLLNFDKAKEKVDFGPAVEFIPELKAVFKDKDLRFKGLYYVFLTTDPTSPYFSDSLEKRKARAKKDTFGTARVPKAVEAACVAYHEHLIDNSPYVRQYMAVRKVYEKMTEYWTKADESEADVMGEEFDTMLKYLKNATQMAKSLKELEELAYSQNFTTTATVADREVNPLEE